MGRKHVKTKQEKVLEYLVSGRTITPLTAPMLAGTTDVSSIVRHLKKKGHVIFTHLKRDGDGSVYASYSLSPSK